MLLTEKIFSEKWLQDLIQKHPAILPIKEIEPNCGPLIPIGREVSVTSGAIDNLFISPQGYITIVETKLWRNPEARRVAVSQIIDYTKDMHKWTIDQLDQQVADYNREHSGNSDGVVATIRKHSAEEEFDERYLVDTICRNLKNGRFLLVIAGDGIREGVEEMAGYLNRYPQHFFTLALVELNVYRMPGSPDSWIVCPNVVTRTKEIVRAVIKVEGISNEDLKLNIITDLEDTPEAGTMKKRYTISQEDFFEQLKSNAGPEMVAFSKEILDECEHRNLYIEWGQGSFSPKLLLPEQNGYISLFIVDRKGKVYLGYANDQLEKMKIDKQISYDYASRTGRLLNVEVNPKSGITWLKYQNLESLRPVFKEFMAEVDGYVERLKNANSVITS